MVSIIVPVYNAEKTIEACVESVLRQTYSDFELILIDDGSTDRSAQLCDAIHDRCAAQNVRCQVIHQQNGGVSRARNVGIAHVNGEYFVCIDSDDTVEPCYLEDLVRTAESHPELGHVLCGFRCTSHAHDYIFRKHETLTIVDRKDYMRLFDAILIQSPCLGLYKTDIVRTHQLKMREDLSLGEDILFNLSYLDALDKTAIGIVNKMNYIYQDEDQSSLYRKFRADLLTISELILEAVRIHLVKWNISDVKSWERYYHAAFCKYTSVLNNTLHKQNPMSMTEKISFNNEILKSESFQEAFMSMSNHISTALKHAYQSGDYRNVIKAERVQRLKSRVAGVMRSIWK